MSSSRPTIIVVVITLLVLAVGGAVLVLPSAREMIVTRREIGVLRTRSAQIGAHVEEVARLATDLQERRTYAETSLKIIPPAPDVADLIGDLSLPVDGVHVIDQTFTAGSPAPALPDEGATTRIMPLTVDLEGSFDSVIGVIQLAESMERLVRVASVRMSTRSADPPSQEPVVTASIGLEIVFQPPVTEEK